MLGQVFDSTLAAAKEGSEWAWAAIYRDLAGQIAGYLASRGAADPEDLTSETFLQAARGIHGFEGDERAFRSWVFVISHRRLQDARRRAGRRIHEVTGTDDLLTHRAGGDVELEAMESLAIDEVWAALESLTDDQRDVLALRIIGGLTLDETAEVVGKRVGAVKALQHRALVALREAGVAGGVPP